MLIKRLLKFPTAVLIVSVISVFCESCENHFRNFQEISQGCKEPGRLEPTASMRLFQQKVFTQMECLDICLRTSECGSLDMKQTQSEKGTQKPWICVINRRVVFEGTMLDLTDKNTGWIHFPVTSQELQRVSWDAKEIRSPNNSSVFWSLDWQFKSYLIVQLYSMSYIQITRETSTNNYYICILKDPF